MWREIERFFFFALYVVDILYSIYRYILNQRQGAINKVPLFQLSLYFVRDANNNIQIFR